MTCSPNSQPANPEAGFSLIELMVAMAVFMVVIAIAMMTTGVMFKDSLAAQSRGTDINQTTSDINQLANVLENAYWPVDTIYSDASQWPYTNDCSSPPSSAGQAYTPFPWTSGPIYAQQPQYLAICTFGIGRSNTTAHTETIQLVNSQGDPCSGQVCTLVVDQWPDPGVVGSPQQMWSIPDVQASGTSLSYLGDSNGTWSPSSTPIATNAITISLIITHGRGRQSPVQRTVVMPNYGTSKL